MSSGVRVWGPAAIWAAFLFYMSSRTTLPVDLAGGLDKVAHFCAYLVLGFLLAYAAEQLRLSWAVALGLGALYGVLDELHQSIVPGRQADIADWVADLLGTLVGVLLFIIIGRGRWRASRRDQGRAEGIHHD